MIRSALRPGNAVQIESLLDSGRPFMNGNNVVNREQFPDTLSRLRKTGESYARI